MRAQGERILIFGDSLSHPGQDSAPAIQAVTQGSNRASSAPGDLLGSILLEQGAQAIQIDAKVGRSAVSFLTAEPVNDLLSADRSFAPTKVIVMLGTNDASRDLAKTETAMIALRDTFKGMGAEVWAVGPMSYVGRGANLNQAAASVFDIMQRVFGKQKLIDARPFSVGADRAGDGIHFSQSGARAVAPQIAQALLTTPAIPKPVVGAAIGFGAVLLFGLAAWFIRRRKAVAAEAISGGKILSYKGHLIEERPTGGFKIVRGDRVVAPYALNVDKAKAMVNQGLFGADDDAAIRQRYENKPDLTEIRSRKPRPLLKLYRHPTPEQAAAHKAAMSAWNSEYRKASKEHKAAVEAMNELYYRQQQKLDGLGLDMLTTIARESKSPEEFALRAEAWAASESKPPTDKELALAFYRAGHPRSMATTIQLIRKARQKRQVASRARFKELIQHHRGTEVEGLAGKRRKKASPELLALEREREQLFRAMEYAGNTPEQVKRYHNKIEEISAKIRALQNSSLGDLGVRPPFEEVVEEIRRGVQGQVDTTDSGKLLTQCNPAAMKNLVKNIVGNVGMAVDYMIDESLEPG